MSCDVEKANHLDYISFFLFVFVFVFVVVVVYYSPNNSSMADFVPCDRLLQKAYSNISIFSAPDPRNHVESSHSHIICPKNIGSLKLRVCRKKTYGIM